MIRFEHLGKTFRGRAALHDLTLEIQKGEIFGLLGDNGAGKSTTFGLLLGEIHPSRGEAFIRGVSVQRNRSQALQGVGAIFETPGFYDYLSGWHNLVTFTGYTARLGKAEIEEIVRFVGLEKRIHDPVRVYSHGMRQRLALAQALLPQPELVLLDEPAEGLDPEGIHEMRHLILRLNREEGMTVLLSSHQLAEVGQLCSHIAILNQGHLVFNGRWNKLARDRARFRLEIDNWEKGRLVLENHGAGVLENQIVELPPGREIADLVTALVQAGLRVSAVEPVHQTLEELYLGKDRRDMNLFWFQLFNELRKMFARKRTYIGFGAFLIMEALVLFMVNLPKPRAHMRRMIEQNGYAFDQYFSGLTLGFLMLMWTIFLLGGLYLALVAGDMVSKEVEEGTLRMTFCRPVSRSRIIALKYISCVIYTFTLIFFIGVSALAAGMVYRGPGGLFVFAPMENIFALHEMWPGMARYFCALPLLALSLTTVSSLGFMLSCFNMKPAATTIVTLSVMFLDSIFHNIPAFESLKPWFMTTHISAWFQVFVTYVPVWSMVEDYAYLLALDATFVVIALAVFKSRDFKA